MVRSKADPLQGLTRDGPDVAHLSGSAHTFGNARTTATKRVSLILPKKREAEASRVVAARKSFSIVDDQAFREHCIELLL